MWRSFKPYQNEHDSVKPTKCSEKEKKTNKATKGKEQGRREREKKDKSLLLSVHVQTLQANNYSASGSEGRTRV